VAIEGRFFVEVLDTPRPTASSSSTHVDLVNAYWNVKLVEGQELPAYDGPYTIHALSWTPKINTVFHYDLMTVPEVNDALGIHKVNFRVILSGTTTFRNVSRVEAKDRFGAMTAEDLFKCLRVSTMDFLDGSTRWENDE
jgi:hypothetical protein